MCEVFVKFRVYDYCSSFFMSATIAFNLAFCCVVIVIMFFVMLAIGGGRRTRCATLIDGRGRCVWAVLLPDNLLAYDVCVCETLVAIWPM